MNTLIVCIGLFWTGTALHLSRVFWSFDERLEARESSMGDALRLLGFHTQLAAVMLILVFLMGWFALVAAGIIVIALGEAAWRHVLQERRALAWVFAAAAAHGVPLTEALSAFYDSKDVGRSSKGVRLISLLSLGMPLHLALQGAGMRLTPGLRLAAAQGVTLGGLPERLARTISDEEELESDLQRLNQKISTTTQILLTLTASVQIASFLMIAVAPVMRKMADEFNLRLPAAAELAMKIGDGIAEQPLLSLVFVCVMGLAPLLLLIVLLHQFGVPLWDYPIVNRFFPAFDRARLYRAIAVSFRRREPLLPMFDQLGIFFPRAYIRSRLRRARNRFVLGESWIAALAKERLIPKIDRQMLESADKHGNVAWTLEELAAIRTQRQVQRLESVATIGNLLMVLGLGLFAMLYGGMMYMFIASLIGGLA